MRLRTVVGRGLGGALAATLVTACGDGGEPEPAEPSAAGPVTLELADVVEHPGEPDFLLEAFGSVWSVTASGYTLRLDPGSGEVLEELDNGYHSEPACNGDGFDDTALWVCSGPEHLARLDPETGELTRVAAAKRSDQTRFPFSAGLVWYLEVGTNALVGLDEAGQVGRRIGLDLVCTSTAYDAETIWVLCPTDGVVLKVDAAAARIVDRVAVTNPRQAAVADDLFVASGDDLLQIDTETLEVLHTYENLGPGTYGDIDATADEVWVRREGGPFLTAIDPATHEVTGRVEASEYPGGGDVLITDDWIWASSFDDNVVVRVARP